MVTLWISVSLLVLSGWQGYRLGKDYGWWGREDSSKPLPDGKDEATPVEPSTGSPAGLGHSKTDFARLLEGYSEKIPTLSGPGVEITEPPESSVQADKPVVEPQTTLSGEEAVGDSLPNDTDQVPEQCTWMEDEEISLMNDDTEAGEVQELGEYIKRVRTVQRKMHQLVSRRQNDQSFLKQELGYLIESYQMQNDQALNWLFEQHSIDKQAEYESVFDRIEKMTR